jgi:hypothetical protein
MDTRSEVFFWPVYDELRRSVCVGNDTTPEEPAGYRFDCFIRANDFSRSSTMLMPFWTANSLNSR